MLNDEIVEEVRKARDQYAKDHHYNIEEIYNDIRIRERASGRTLVSFPPKHPTRSEVSHNDQANAA